MKGFLSRSVIGQGGRDAAVLAAAIEDDAGRALADDPDLADPDMDRAAVAEADPRPVTPRLERASGAVSA